MNILILTDTYPPDYLSGVAEVAKNLNDSFTASGHSVYVLTTGKKREEEQGGIYRSSKSLIWGVFINNFIVFSILRKHKIDAIHSHQSSSNFFLIFRIFGFIVKFPKIITTLHVTYFSEFAQIRPVTVEGHTFKPTFIEYIQKYFFAPIHIIYDLISYVFADEVTTLSTEGKKEILETYGKLFKKNIHIIPNGINLNSNTPIEFKKNLDLEKKLENKTVLIYTGAFRIRKRVFNLIFALSHVVKKNNNVILLLIGGGRGYDDILKSLAEELGLSDHVIFIGKVPRAQIPYYLNLSDIFCLVSSYEGMPISILEAMAAEKPTLTSRVCGMTDLIEDGKTGYFVEVDNIRELANTMDKLAFDRKKAKNMGENAFRTVKEKYSWRAVAEKYCNLMK